MIFRVVILALFMTFSAPAFAGDLATAPSGQLLQEYKQLRSLQGSTQGAVAENVVFKRDAGTFTLEDGRLTFAAVLKNSRDRVFRPLCWTERFPA